MVLISACQRTCAFVHAISLRMQHVSYFMLLLFQLKADFWNDTGGNEMHPGTSQTISGVGKGPAMFESGREQLQCERELGPACHLQTQRAPRSGSKRSNCLCLR